ncbi:MAG: tRNA lysidine(34) synthetase TilS [Xanthomonadaceae bacterium]|nr:tRNA lysidine(34) synthetase TilS [Xanthomonadaceae bacterium]
MNQPLLSHLARALATVPPVPLCVAYSGGPDSTALLHALAQLPAACAGGLRALHVDHGLHPDSPRWAGHCLRFCAALEVPCEVLPVRVDTGSGGGLEAAARHARYAALTAQLQEGEWLLLGHHRDDQVETVLLKLLRGAGPQGLGGMRALRPLGPGQLWRPLLALSRRQLREYVDTNQLSCIDDPSNGDTRLARNQLRHEILPRLMRHWPHAVDSILHSAALCQAAADALRVRWLEAFATRHDPATGSLCAADWLALDRALREPLLDHWLHTRGLPAPTTAQRRQIERQCGARAGQSPCIRWPGVELHIWKGRLWAQPPRPAVAVDWHAAWRGEPLALPDGGVLSLTDADARLPEPLDVRLRRGGERIKPAGDAHTRALRDLFQQGLIPPWQRIACPLLYAGDELVAVADRWISARGIAIFRHAAARPRWLPAG